MSGQPAEALVELLRLHRIGDVVGGTAVGSTWRCLCGEGETMNGTRDYASAQGARHLAAVVSEYVEAREREAAASAWCEGLRAGMDTGIGACEAVSGLRLEIPPVPANPYRADRVEHPGVPRSAANHTDGIRVPQDAETPSDRRPDSESGTPDAEGPMHERLTDVLVWFTPGDRTRAEEIAQAVIDAGFRDGEGER